MDFTTYISPELLILIPVLYVMGRFLKMSEIENKYIPFILLAQACILAFCLNRSFSLSGIVQAIIQGILIAGTTVFANEMVVQSNKIKK